MLSRLQRPSPLEWIYIAITVFSVIWVSVLGIILALLGALHGYYEDRWELLIGFAVLAAIGLGLEVSKL